MAIHTAVNRYIAAYYAATDPRYEDGNASDQHFEIYRTTTPPAWHGGRAGGSRSQHAVPRKTQARRYVVGG
jgi:hypothetical protein